MIRMALFPMRRPPVDNENSQCVPDVFASCASDHWQRMRTVNQPNHLTSREVVENGKKYVCAEKILWFFPCVRPWMARPHVNKRLR